MKFFHLGIEVVDRSWQADEKSVQSISTGYSVSGAPLIEFKPFRVSAFKDIVFNRKGPILVGVKEFKNLVKQCLKEGIGDALEDVTILFKLIFYRRRTPKIMSPNVTGL